MDHAMQRRSELLPPQHRSAAMAAVNGCTPLDEEKAEDDGENGENDEGEEEDEEGEEEENDVEVEEAKPDEEIAKEEFENVEILTPRSLQKRVKKLTDSITYTAFSNVRRGLFEQHKLIFATLMTFRILIEQGELLQSEVDHLIVGK